MRIIQVFNRYLNPGGEENSVRRIAEDLGSGGHQVTRFWRSSQEWLNADSPPRWRQLLLLWDNPDVLEALRRRHLDERADCWILHNVIPIVSLGIYGLAKRLSVPIVQWLHNYRPISPSGTLFAGRRLLEPDDPWLAWKETLAGSWRGRFLTAWVALGYRRLRWRRDFDSVCAWVAVSEEMRGLFIRGGLPKERLHVLRHSWNRRVDSPPVGDNGSFLFLGRIIEAKGIRFLIDLWQRPALRDVRLVVAGRGELESELRKVSPPNVEWVGYVEGDQKRRLLADCRAVLFPCTWPEPLSTVAYEAYEAAKPILASPRGGMREIVFHETTGQLLDVARPHDWLSAILGLRGDPERARRLGENGRRWLEENVSAEKWNEQFNAIVRAALEHSESSRLPVDPRPDGDPTRPPPASGRSGG